MSHDCTKNTVPEGVYQTMPVILPLHHVASPSPMRASSHYPLQLICSWRLCLQGFVSSIARCYNGIAAIEVENVQCAMRHT
jgi:hypothetical protein